MFGYVSHLWLLSALCFQLGEQDKRSQRYTLRRDGYRLKGRLDFQEVQCSTLATCAASCTLNISCQGISFEATSGRCLMAMGIPDLTAKLINELIPVAGWTTMSRWIYTVFQHRGSGGRYHLTFEEAAKLCEDEQTVLATPDAMFESRALGLDLCACGWLSTGIKGLVRQNTSHCYPGVRSDQLVHCNVTETAYAWCRL